MHVEDPHGRTGDERGGGERETHAVAWASTTPEIPDQIEQDLAREIYSAPRRFDLATLLVIMVAYALLFSVMRVLQARLDVFAIVAGFFTAVGLGQALLFKSESPRAASVLVGIIYLPTALLQVGWHPCLALGMFIQGGLLGYVAGTLVGGVFLVADKIRRSPEASRRPS